MGYWDTLPSIKKCHKVKFKRRLLPYASFIVKEAAGQRVHLCVHLPKRHNFVTAWQVLRHTHGTHEDFNKEISCRAVVGNWSKQAAISVILYLPLLIDPWVWQVACGGRRLNNLKQTRLCYWHSQVSLTHLLLRHVWTHHNSSTILSQ